MTLPFRRRHHDSEAGHDRARTLMSDGLLVTLEPDDATWLARHLDGCAECGRDWKAFRADRKLLRTLRDQPPEPPRDLWAKTSAALDREAEKRGAPAASRAAYERGRRSGWRAFPVGAGASVLVLAVLIGSILIPRDGGPPRPSALGTLPVAVNSTPAPTGLDLPPADPVAILRETANGSWEFVYKDVREVCPKSNRSCVPKPSNDGDAQPIDIGERPSDITLSPTDPQLAIVSESNDGNPGRVLVVPVAEPGESPAPIVTEPPSSGETPDPSATPAPTPPGAIEIATGITVVGDVAYSEDGRWLAFSAEPADGSTGPDLYLWSAGQPEAIAVTSDHQTYFSSWHHGAVLASRVEIPGAPTAPDASAEPDATAKPGKGNQGDGNQGGNQGGGKARATAPPTAAPTATAGAGASSGPGGSAAAPVEGRPISFLVDPESLERTDLSRPDVWLPVLDPAGQFVVYWSGTLISDDGHAWALGTGELVLDRWSTGNEPGASGELGSNGPGESVEPSPAPILGPSGAQVILVSGAKATFEVSFDPNGERLAIWVGEALDEEVGRLHLLTLDRETGTVAEGSPLRGEAALRRFSIDKGRLAWVTPRGQDGKESTVQVLGWKGDNFGEIETEPGSDLYLP
jgi:hypothetical protein